MRILLRNVELSQLSRYFDQQPELSRIEEKIQEPGHKDILRGLFISGGRDGRVAGPNMLARKLADEKNT